MHTNFGQKYPKTAIVLRSVLTDEDHLYSILQDKNKEIMRKMTLITINIFETPAAQAIQKTTRWRSEFLMPNQYIAICTWSCHTIDNHF